MLRRTFLGILAAIPFWRKAWIQSTIARWRWLPEISVTPGMFNPYDGVYRPSWRIFYWGRWIIAWHTLHWPEDRLEEGALVGNRSGVDCFMRHWTS